MESSVPRELGAPESWPTGTLLAAVGRLAERAWNRRLAELGVTATGISVLIALEDGPRSQAELAAATHVTGQSMGRTIDRLERQALVERRPHPTDRRRIAVSRARRGDEVLGTALHGQPGTASAFDRLPDQDRLRADLILLIKLLDPRP